MLALSGEAVYINEPLNPKQYPGRSPGLFRGPVDHRFQYICEDNEADYLSAYRDLMQFRYCVIDDLRAHRARSDLTLLARHSIRFGLARLRRRRALVADPYAVFSSAWFRSRLGFQVVAIVRNPAAVIASRKRLGWGGFDFRQLLSQPLLVRDWLAPFRSDLEEMVGRPDDPVGEGGVLWRVIYNTIDELRSTIPTLLVVRHEDLSSDPAHQFERLYGLLRLRFTPAVRRSITAATGAGNPTELETGRPHATRLDSRANLDNWKRRLEPEEITRIKSLTGDVSARFYPDMSWDTD